MSEPVDEGARRVALAIAYDGTRFDGYPRQPDPRLRTVEGALLERLVDIGAITDPTAARFRSGSRTDKGVSARRNVVAFDADLPVEGLVGAIGTRTDGLWPLGAVAVHPDFEPREASARTYRYHVRIHDLLPQDEARMRRPAWEDDDVRAASARFDAALAAFEGTHDLRRFARMEPDRDPVRTVLSARVVQHAEVSAVVEVRGRSFLWHQVRKMIAGALRVAREEVPLAVLEAMIAEPGRHKEVDPGRAPAWPLVLWDVHYEGVRFETPPRVAGRLMDVFSQARHRNEVRGSLYDALDGLMGEPAATRE